MVHVAGTLATTVDDETVVPFISHTAVLPELSRQRMSLLPSPLKSPVSDTDHDVGTLPMKVLDVTPPLPLSSQIATLPVLSRHRMSVLPSPLKSPEPTIDQEVGTLPSEMLCDTVPPFMIHSAVFPEV